MTQKDFEFTKDELILLANIQYTALHGESKIAVKGIKYLVSKKKTQKEDEKELLKLKSDWIEAWKKITLKLLKIDPMLYNNEVLTRKIKEFIKNSSYDKQVVFALECACFIAYYPFDEDKKQLHFLDKEYLKQLAPILKPMKLPNNALQNLRDYYSNNLEKVSNELKTGFQKYSKLIATVSAVAIVALLTPFIAASIGGAMGLSGAAASSAGLAFLGGGSLATGGAGILGGTFVLLGGGALAGYTGGKILSDKDLENLKSENLIISTAKLLSVTKLLAENKKIDFHDMYKFLESLRNMQFKFEENLDKFVCLTEKLDEEKYKSYKNNALIIDFSRKEMLKLLIDNKN